MPEDTLEPTNPTEPLKSKIAYQDYLGLGPGRTPELLYMKYCKAVGDSGAKPYASLTQIKGWRKDWGWDAKVMTDIGSTPLDEVETLNRLDIMRVEREAAIRRIEEWDEVQAAHRSKMVDVGERLLERALQMLEAPIFKDEIQEDGMTIVRVPIRWGSSDIARYIEVADKAVRLAAEMDTNRQRITVDREQAQRVADKLGITVDEVIERANQLMNESKK